jgi:hypothetical protein
VFSLTSLLVFEHYVGEFEFLRFATGSVNDSQLVIMPVVTFFLSDMQM